eukprot:SAG22_NODE_130_length_18670_cov_12.091379_17_plen_414_part_00
MSAAGPRSKYRQRNTRKGQAAAVNTLEGQDTAAPAVVELSDLLLRAQPEVAAGDPRPADQQLALRRPVLRHLGVEVLRIDDHELQARQRDACDTVRQAAGDKHTRYSCCEEGGRKGGTAKDGDGGSRVAATRLLLAAPAFLMFSNRSSSVLARSLAFCTGKAAVAIGLVSVCSTERTRAAKQSVAQELQTRDMSEHGCTWARVSQIGALGRTMPQAWQKMTPYSSRYHFIMSAAGALPPQASRSTLSSAPRLGCSVSAVRMPCQIVGTPAEKVTPSAENMPRIEPCTDGHHGHTHKHTHTGRPTAARSAGSRSDGWAASAGKAAALSRVRRSAPGSAIGSCCAKHRHRQPPYPPHTQPTGSMKRLFMQSLVPSISEMNGSPHDMTWNIGTIDRMVSAPDSVKKSVIPIVTVCR